MIQNETNSGIHGVKKVFFIWCCICNGALGCSLNTACELTGSAGLRSCPSGALGLCWSRRACSASPCCAVRSAQPSPAHASYTGPAHEPWEYTHTHRESELMYCSATETCCPRILSRPCRPCCVWSHHYLSSVPELLCRFCSYTIRAIFCKIAVYKSQPPQSDGITALFYVLLSVYLSIFNQDKRKAFPILEPLFMSSRCSNSLYL